MGIVFFCPSCNDRLNVKSHQAGQEGLCPKCGGDINVPQDSSPVVGQSIDLERANGESTSQSMTMGERGNVPPQRPVAPGGNRKKGVPPAILDDGDSFLLGKPEIRSLGATAEDVIRSGLKKIWYVRHPRDGETGPVKGDKIRAMLNENNISTGCMIWREDWDSWEPAERAFPDLVDQLNAAAEHSARASSGKTKSLKARLNNAKTGKSKTRGGKSAARRKQQTKMVVAIVIGIAAIVALAVLLIQIF